MDWMMFVELAGGLGLFLFGMRMMGEGLENAAGNRLKRLLEILTNNKYLGVLVGVVITGLIQSSSATTVMVLGFVNANIMSLAQAVGVIMGANIGTTVTAQLVAFKLTSVAPAAILVGLVMIMFTKKKRVQHIGTIIAGFGILFFGMETMSRAMVPLRSMPEFINFLVHFKNPLVGVLTGALVTSVIQSSSASVGILQVLAMQNLIGLDGAIFVLFGQNIGTCITALIASIGAHTNARRAAIIHLLFNVLGTAFFMLIMLLPFVRIVPWMQALSPGDVSRQIANTHTLFNLTVTALLLPFSNVLVKISERLIPDKPDEKAQEYRLQYLDTRILETPPIAVGQLKKEVDRMAMLAQTSYNRSVEAIRTLDEEAIAEVLKREELIDYLNHEITEFLVHINNLELNESDHVMVANLFHVINDIERIGDHAENLAEYAQFCIENQVVFSAMAQEELQRMHGLVSENVRDCVMALAEGNTQIAEKVEPREDIIDDLRSALRLSHIERLAANQCTPKAAIIFLDLVNNMERVSDHTSNIAFTVIELYKGHSRVLPKTSKSQ